MTVRIWSSDVSAWEPKSAPSSSSSSSPPLPSRRELARIRTRHSSNVFQAFFVDPGDEGSELLTCAADGAVRVMSVPRAQRDRLLFPSGGGGGGRSANGDPNAADAAVVGHRCLFWHGGRAHKMALAPGSPSEFATCGEDGVVATFDLRERGRGGGSGFGSGGGGGGEGEGSSSAPSPLTAAVGPAALAAAARAPGRSCFPPSDRGCSRAAAAASSSNVDATLYSVSFDPRRPWLLAVGGDASEMDLGDRPVSVVLDRRMLSIPPSEAFRRRRPAGGGGGGSRLGRRGRGGRGRRERGGDGDERGEGGGDFYSDDDDDDSTGPDPAAGTIFARGSIFRELIDSRRIRLPPLGTLDAARVSCLFFLFFLPFWSRERSSGGVRRSRFNLRNSRFLFSPHEPLLRTNQLPAKSAAVVQGSALPAHLGAFRCGDKASRSARRHARFHARGASVTGESFLLLLRSSSFSPSSSSSLSSCSSFFFLSLAHIFSSFSTPKT